MLDGSGRTRPPPQDFFFWQCLRSEATESESRPRFVKGVDGGGRVRAPPHDLFFLSVCKVRPPSQSHNQGRKGCCL